MELINDKFKDSIFGLIPHDWKVFEFQDVMDGFSSGQTPYRGKPEYYTGNIPWITSGELNYNTIIDTIEKISPEGAKDANLKIIPKGTFLFAITGLEAAGTRGSCAITGIEATTNQSCMALYPKKGMLSTSYLYHFYVKYGNELAFKYCQGTKQQSFTGGIAKKLPIVLPNSINEQTAIASTLSDMDALIAQTEKLIEKKKAIKQGVMQELLRPKEGWVTKKLGEIANCFAGGTPSTFNRDFWGDKIPWLPSGRVKNNIIKPIENEITITDLGLSSSAAKMIKPNSILIAITGATCGNIGLLTFNAAANQSVVAIEQNDEFDSVLVYYILLTMRDDILRLQTGSAQGGVNLKSVKSLEVIIPKKIEEQNEISQILWDFDKEIESYNQKLTKLKLQKQGMMQALLTGKIRLV